MIKSFRDEWLRSFYLDNEMGARIPAQIQNRLFRKLQLVDDASKDSDLRAPPGNHFEKLKGNLVGRHSIRVNKQWRLIFAWQSEGGEATDVYLDNHDYR